MVEKRLYRFSRIRSFLRTSNYLPIAFFLFLAGFFLTPVDNFHRDYYYLFILLPFCLSVRISDIQGLIRTRLFFFSFLFLAYILVSGAWSDCVDNTCASHYGDAVKYFCLVISIILISGYLCRQFPEAMTHLPLLISSVAAISALSSMIVFYSSHPFPGGRLLGWGDHLDDNPIMASLFFGVIGMGSIYAFYRTKHLWQKVCLGFCFFIIVLFIVFSQSRGPLLALVLCFVMSLCFERQWRKLFVFMVIGGAFLMLIEFGDIGMKGFIERGASCRFELWSKAWVPIKQNLWLGQGVFTEINIPTSRGNVLHSPHNLLLLIMMQCGVVGGTLLIALVSEALILACKKYSMFGNWLPLCVFVFFVVSMSFDTIYLLYKPSISWVMLWIPVGCLCAVALRTKEKAERNDA